MSSKYKIANLGYTFYNQGAEGKTKLLIGYSIDEKKDDLLKRRIKPLKSTSNHEGWYSFVAKTTYPGLAIGLSNPAMADGILLEDKEDEQVKTGFLFDYSTGLPYIPGSTVKGIIRSGFQKYEKDIKTWLEKETNAQVEVGQIRDELFGDSKQLSNPYKRDVFFGGIIAKEQRGQLLKEDYITPHPSMFENPIPIKIVVLKPGLLLEFSFKLKKGMIGGLGEEQRFELYKGLLLDLGVGAKTNVGYGYLVEQKVENKAI